MALKQGLASQEVSLITDGVGLPAGRYAGITLAALQIDQIRVYRLFALSSRTGSLSAAGHRHFVRTCLEEGLIRNAIWSATGRNPRTRRVAACLPAYWWLARMLTKLLKPVRSLQAGMWR